MTPTIFQFIPFSALLGVLLSCEHKTTPVTNPGSTTQQPPATQAALTIGEVSITHGEIETLVKFIRDTDPRMGRSKCIRVLLDQHLIPLAFVKHEFSEQLRVQHDRAAALVQTIGQAGYDELTEKAARMPGYEVHENAIRQHVTIPEQQWLFDDLKVGQMSPILTSPYGYSVVAAKSKRTGPTTAFDNADVVVVRFAVLTRKEFDLWFADLKDRIRKLPAKSIVYHQNLEDALPPWLPKS